MIEKNQRMVEELISEIATLKTDESITEQIIEIQKKFDLDDIIQILTLLNKVNKTTLKKIVSIQEPKESSKTKSKKSLPQKLYTVDEVRYLFKNKSINEILQSYTKKELENMYVTVAERNPLSSDSKARIAKSVEQHFRAEARGQAIYKNYIAH
ncbi:hypothetical protein [Enterococcus sp. LJL51]|uniref:hypothetical protein n=1 Tax=Enterococcus sp. LJL51 TaxID=3416656 RepID=UPI003CED74CA